MQLFYLQVQIFYFTFAYLSGKPGHSPNNIVEGGGEFLSASYRLPLSRQCFLCPYVCKRSCGDFGPNPQPAGKAFPRKFGTKNPERANKAANATGFIVIFASGFFNAYT